MRAACLSRRLSFGFAHRSLPRLPFKAPSIGFRRARGEALLVAAKLERDRGFHVEQERSGSGWRVSFNEAELFISNQTLTFSGLALLGMGVVIGPLIIAIALTAMSIGVALTFAFSFAMFATFMPLALLLSVGGMAVFAASGFTFVGVIIPKAISFVLAGAALALGWTAVRKILPVSEAVKVSKPAQKEQDQLLPDPGMEEEALSWKELRDFDKLLAEREKRRGRPR